MKQAIFSQASRRAFLRQSRDLSVVGMAAPWALNLATMAEAAAATASDYKALVCLFLYGGNDYGNTLIPETLTQVNVPNPLPDCRRSPMRPPHPEEAPSGAEACQ